MENSKISWTHHTANLWWGCTEVHAGCDHCYAKTLSHRYDGGNSLWGNDAPRRRIKSTFSDLDKYQRKAKDAGEIHRVFVGSMMDIFEKPMPLLNPVDHYENTDDLRQEFFTRINVDLYPNLLFLLLTKRPSNIHKYVPAGWLDEPPKNVMYGVSISDQNDPLVLQLLRVPGKRFLSIEPLISRVNLYDLLWIHANGIKQPKIGWDEADKRKNAGIDWVIVGGESGSNARSMSADWARLLRDQCEASNIPYFFKQWGEWAPVFDKSGNYKMWRVGKNTAGHLLDGKEHHEFPVI